MSKHVPECPCYACHAASVSDKEKDLHIRLSENSRRDFLKKAAGLGLGLGLGGGLIPLSASALNQQEGALKSLEMLNNKAVKQGKASVITLLHTADIHGQLLTHDEFFIENGKPVYKKRGGYATLKTMVNALRNQNPEN